MSEYNFYQIDHTGVSEPDVATYVRTDTSTTIRRAADAKISTFGALNVGTRMDSDYGRTSLDFESKDTLSDWKSITEIIQDADRIDNPYLAGSTVKRARDAQFFRMGMSNDNGAEIDLPKFDVSDANNISSGMTAGKNWPSEGWRSFGGKYDFMPYVGGDIH